MTWIILLFILGLLLLAFEVIVPGGVIGAIGGLMMFGGCLVAFAEYGSVGGLISVGVALACALLTFIIEFRFLPRTRWGRRAFLTSEVAGSSCLIGTDAQALVGASAEALTRLSPSGYVTVHGTRYEAFCQSGQVAAGTQLSVISVDNFRLIVTPTSTPIPTPTPE